MTPTAVFDITPRHPADVRLGAVPDIPAAVRGLLAGRGLVWLSDLLRWLAADPLDGEYRSAYVLWAWSEHALPFTVCLDAEDALRAAIDRLTAGRPDGGAA